MKSQRNFTIKRILNLLNNLSEYDLAKIERIITAYIAYINRDITSG